MSSKAIYFLIFLFTKTQASWGINRKPIEENFSEEYGVDTTSPIHHYLDKNTFYGQRYDKMISGCIKKFSLSECKGNEDARIKMNLDQPATQVNYTEIGFKKIKTPQAVWEPLINFYQENINQAHPEKWPRGNTYTNNWDSQTFMISLEDRSLRGGNGELKKLIWDGVKPIIEEWTGQKIEPSSLYGIRVYKDGAVLATHVDRLPLVSSCIIQVAQDVDEPWPIEVYSHDGKAYNVTMQPGDMVLYESHTVLHGRPFPLKGRHYANVFVHYIPVDHDENNRNFISNGKVKSSKKSKIKEHKVGGHEQSNLDEQDIKFHIDKHKNNGINPKYEEMNRMNNLGLDSIKEDGQTRAHKAAAKGDINAIETIYNAEPHLINYPDSNNWLPIHEASRAGHLEVLKYLIEIGADIGAKTSNGATPLWWAKRSLPRGHSVISYLTDIGAPEEGDL